MTEKEKKPPSGAEPFESLSQTWWLSEVTPGMRKLYASLIRARARQRLYEDKPILSPEEYAEEKESLQGRIDAGEYDWGPPVELGGPGAGKAIRAAFDSDEGKLRLVQLLLSETHGDIGFQQTAEIIEGNPEGLTAALRAALGIPPLAPTPASQPGTTTKSETNAAPPAGGSSN